MGDADLVHSCAIPISFQGIGVLEGLFAYFLSAGGFSATDGLAIAFLLRLAEVVLGFLPATIMLWLSPLKIQPDIDPCHES